MFDLKVINSELVREMLNLNDIIEVVEEAYTQKAKGKADLFPMIFHEFDPGKADMDIKSGYVEDSRVFGLKLVSWFGNNPSKNLPALVGTIAIFDMETGVPVGILNASEITGMRTGAAGGIGAKYLARKDSENLLIIGAGHQAPYQIAAILSVMENIKKVTVIDPLSYDNSLKFVSEIKDRLGKEFFNKYKKDDDYYRVLSKKFDIVFEAAENIENAVREADIIITATPSRKPMIMKEWVKPGTHFSCMGSDAEGKQEIDENIFKGAKVFVDDINQAVTYGETEMPLKKGIILKKDIIGEIGELILGEKQGRVSDEDITIFDSTGIALQDLLSANYILQKAIKENKGTTVSL